MDKSLVTDGGDTYVKETGNYPLTQPYARVKSVEPTPDYFDNDGMQNQHLQVVYQQHHNQDQ